MNQPALRGLIRRILLPIFLLSLLAGAGGFYLLLYREAIREAEPPEASAQFDSELK